MTLETFLLKWRVDLSPAAEQLATTALGLLHDSKDPTHDEQHVYSLLANADNLLEQEPLLKEKVNFEVLVLSIIWHDVWRAGRIPTNALQLLYTFLWDGMGSRKLFVTYAENEGLDNNTLHSVAYAVRKHHSVQFLPRATIESKILKDCDELELWSLARAKLMYKYALEYLDTVGMKKLTRQYLKMKLKRSIKTVYFGTTARLLKQRMKVFLREFDDEIATF